MNILNKYGVFFIVLFNYNISNGGELILYK